MAPSRTIPVRSEADMSVRSRRDTGRVNAASMSDIAFLLLIFFLVTTIFAFEEGIPMVLPAKAPAKKVKRDAVVTLKAHANGSITFDDKPLRLAEVKPRVEARLAENDRLVVVLETHRDSEYGLLVDLLDELRLAKARRVSLRSSDGPSKLLK